MPVQPSLTQSIPTPPDRRIRKLFRITGRVQGVYFRHSTRVEAQRLGLGGVARNLPDGSVEVLAYGDAAALESLRDWLQRGPPRAQVTAVQEMPPGEIGQGDAGPGVFSVE